MFMREQMYHTIDHPVKETKYKESHNLQSHANVQLIFDPI